MTTWDPRVTEGEIGYLAERIAGALISPNEADRNLEPANVVDGLFAVARAIDRLAAAIGPRPLDLDAYATLTDGEEES